MKISRLDPQALISQALKSAEQSLKGQGAGPLDAAALQRLPRALQAVAQDAFEGRAVKAQDLLGAYQKSLESTLQGSLRTGEFLAQEGARAIDLVAFTPAGVLLAQTLVEQSKPKTAGEADLVAAAALKGANATVTSQIALHGALTRALALHQSESPKGKAAKDLATMVKERGALLKKSVDETLKAAEQGLKKGEKGAKEAAQVALAAALEVYKAVSPKSSRIKTLQKRQAELGKPGKLDRAQGLPFFARFLESQKAQGEAPKLDGPIGQMVTLKYPSDNEDDVGGPVDRVTKKFPSDNEDGATGGDDGRIGGMVTMKYPSDNEDGATGGDDGRIGGMVTMKYPSDNEDGAPELIVEIAPELRPELRPELIVEVAPELRPELRPELIVEIAPELRPGGPDAVTKRALTAEMRVNALLFAGGPSGVENRASELGDLLVRARLPKETYETLKLEKEALHATNGGASVVKAAIDEREGLLRTAMMTPEASAQVMAEIKMFKGLQGDLATLDARVQQLGKQRSRMPAENAERAILARYHGEGIKSLLARVDELDTILARGASRGNLLELKLERDGLKGFLNGAEWISNRITEIDDFMQRAMLSPEAVTAHSQERTLLKNLYSDLQAFDARASALKAELGESGPHPELIVEVAPELRPELRPELIVEIAPELRPELRPELIVEIAPELRPGGIGATRQKLEIEGGVMKSLWNGMVGVDERIAQITKTLQTARLLKPARDQLEIERAVLTAALAGGPGLEAHLAKLDDTLARALLSPDALAYTQLERATTAAVLTDYQALSKRMDQLGRRRHRTPTEALELAVVKAAWHGKGALEGRMAEIDDLMTRARLTEDGMLQLSLERAGMKAYLHGGQLIRDRVKELENIMATSRMTEEAKKKLDAELALMRALEPNVACFEERAMQIGEELAALQP